LHRPAPPPPLPFSWAGRDVLLSLATAMDFLDASPLNVAYLDAGFGSAFVLKSNPFMQPAGLGRNDAGVRPKAHWPDRGDNAAQRRVDDCAAGVIEALRRNADASTQSELPPFYVEDETSRRLTSKEP
jgi:hypothetical protein